MKTSTCCACLVALLSVTTTWAQQQTPRAPAPGGDRVGVIDVSRVFKEHPRFKQAMESMKQEVQAFEGTLRERAKEIDQLREQMKQYQTDSAEYKQTEAKAMKTQADGQIAAAQKKKEFLDREARVYYNVYNEIVAEVNSFADQHGFSLILRFNSESIDPKNRQSVLEGVNRSVVVQKNLNITGAIIDRLERRHGGPTAGTAGRPPQSVAAPR